MKAFSLQNRILFELPDAPQRLERSVNPGGAWLVLTDAGYAIDDGIQEALPVQGNYIDTHPAPGICQYRARDYDGANDWDYSEWLCSGNGDPIGYTFGNYAAPEGSWGEVVTADDLRYTYLWGVDFRASNGARFTDGQIKFYIDSALNEVERTLNITIKKTRIASEPERRGLVKGTDYDAEEPYYTFRREKIQRQGFVKTRTRPILAISKFDLLVRHNTLMSLLPSTIVDKTKGLLKHMYRPYQTAQTTRGIETAISPYGADTVGSQNFYSIDYVAGFETSDDVPQDLRELVAKKAAMSLLNIIGRGLMSGFSSSSLSMDGVSESFSSTQCATSAFYGADIKEYKDDIEEYLKENKLKFGHIIIGVI